MACEICGREGRHAYRCPYYSPKKAVYYCSICREGIYDGEEYIENDDREYIHYDCITGIKDLLHWLGYDLRIMEDTYDEGDY